MDRVGTALGVPEYGPPDAALLTGTPYGTSPAFGNSTNTYDKAFDGDPSTFFDYSQADGGYPGIDLGAGHAAQVVKIRFVPRSNQPGRMVGGVFQGCTDGPTTGCHTLATVPWTPSYEWTELPVFDPTQYRWLRYVSPDGGFCHVAEIQFYTAAPSPAQVAVSPPASLSALAGNTVTASVTNSSDAPLTQLAARLEVASANDDGVLSAEPAADAAVVVPPHHTTTLRWGVTVPLSAPAADYRMVVRVSWAGGHTEGCATSTLPAPISATLRPARLQLAADASGISTLQVSSTAGAPVRVTWQATGSPVTVTPSSGTLTVAAGGEASVALHVTAGNTPGVASMPITLTASGGGQTVPAGAATLAVVVPFPSLAAAFDNIGITDDSNINPSGLSGGIEATVPRSPLSNWRASASHPAARSAMGARASPGPTLRPVSRTTFWRTGK